MHAVKTQTRSGFFHGYWILLAAFLTQVVLHGSAGYSFSLYVLPLVDEFGWTRAAIMTGNLLLSLAMGFSSPLIGRVIYKWGSPRVMAAGALVMGVCFALLSRVQSIWQFYVLFAINGLAMTAAGVLPASMVVSNWFKKRRGLAIGILGAGIGVGGFIVPWALSNFIIPGYGWRSAYLFTGLAVAAVIIPLALFVIRQTPEEMGFLPDNGDVGEDTHHRASGAPEPGLKLDQAIKTPAFWLLAFSFTVFSYANGHNFQNQVPHLQDVGFPAVQAAFAVQAVGIGSAIGKFCFGWLCDYIKSKYILIIGATLQAGATLILMNINDGSPVALLWVYGLLMGLGVGSWLPALTMTTSTTFGLVSYGVIFGILNMLFGIGGAIGPVVGGYIFDTSGSYNFAFVLCLIAYGLSVPTMFLVRTPKVKEP